MPEEFEDLLNSIGGGAKEDVVTPVETPEPTEPIEPVVEEPEEMEEPEETPEENTPEETPKETPKADTPPEVPPVQVEESKQAKAFAEMRVKNAAYEKVLKGRAEREGISLEAYMAKLQDEELTERAKALQVTPEYMRRLEALEQENNGYKKVQLQLHIQSQFAKLSTELKLDDSELQAFGAQLVAANVNLEDTSMDYVQLYRGMNYEKLVEKKLEAERQIWLQARKKSQNASNPLSQSGRHDARETGSISSITELDQFLSTMDKK